MQELCGVIQRSYGSEVRKLTKGFLRELRNLPRLTRVLQTAGRDVLLGTETRVLIGIIIDDSGRQHQVGLSCPIVPKLGRHVSFSPDAATRGSSIVIVQGNSCQVNGAMTIPLQQFPENMGLGPVQMELDIEDDVLEESSPTPPTDGTAMAVQASADI